MKKAFAIVTLAICATVITAAFTDAFKSIREALIGYEEVPSVSTTGNGEFSARINKEQTAIDYTLSYSDLEGAVTQAHIHLGQKSANGGISVFLCSNLGNGPAGTQPCPPPPATITGTITAVDVIGPVPQGIAAGEFEELLAAIRSGNTYVNVHSTKHPTGEIRSQINHNDDHATQK